MNLQILVPYQKCIFNCPFCISKTHRHKNRFKNLYNLDNKKWQLNLIEVLEEYKDINSVIITGTSEPLLNIECVMQMIDIIRKKRSDISIEIQTRYYLKTSVSELVDVMAYSISDVNMLNKPYLTKRINRYVILLTNFFNNYSLNSLLSMIPDRVKQITFKTLHDSDGYNKKIDRWIKHNMIDLKTMKKLEEEVLNYEGVKSIRMDKNCMDAKDRYMIFREDGQIYLDWDQIEPI